MTEGKPSLIRRFTYILIFLLFSLAISCSGGNPFNRTGKSSTAYTPPSPEPTPVDARANHLKMLMLDGTSTTIQDLIGNNKNNKVVLVNFWATWCPPCRAEIPDLVALQQEYKDKGLEVIGLSLNDPESDQEEVKAFAKKFSINYRIGFSSEEILKLFTGPNDPRLPIPQTYIFDRNGKLIDDVKRYRSGFRAWAEGAVNYALNNL